MHARAFMYEQAYYVYTKIEEFLSGFIGIHTALLEHCINILIAVLSGYLLDVLDRLLQIVRNRNPRSAAHCFSNECKAKIDKINNCKITKRKNQLWNRHYCYECREAWTVKHAERDGGEDCVTQIGDFERENRDWLRMERFWIEYLSNGGSTNSSPWCCGNWKKE